MLTLERQVDQSIIVEHQGEILKLLVTHAQDGEAKLSFDAPGSFIIQREELVKEQE